MNSATSSNAIGGGSGSGTFGALTVKPFVCNPFSTNTFVVHGDSEAVIVDASPLSGAELDAVYRYVAAKELTVVRALLTHAHIDHVFGCGPLAERFDVTWEVHPADMPLYLQAPQQAAMFGVAFRGGPVPAATLDEQTEIAFAGTSWQVVHTPGHSPGSVSFVDRANGFVLSGDVLFRGSVGRTDLWEGSYPVLIESIEENLMTLPDDTVVFSGHGPSTTVGHERKTNPFLTDGSRSAS